MTGNERVLTGEIRRPSACRVVEGGFAGEVISTLKCTLKIALKFTLKFALKFRLEFALRFTLKTTLKFALELR